MLFLADLSFFVGLMSIEALSCVTSYYTFASCSDRCMLFTKEWGRSLCKDCYSSEFLTEKDPAKGAKCFELRGFEIIDR
jgi:hypothetical protein